MLQNIDKKTICVFFTTLVSSLFICIYKSNFKMKVLRITYNSTNEHIFPPLQITEYFAMHIYKRFCQIC